jgi:hypothetical protein
VERSRHRHSDGYAVVVSQRKSTCAVVISVQGGFGIQRITSQLLFVAPGNEGAPRSPCA